MASPSDFRPFNMAEAISAGQNLAANDIRLSQSVQQERARRGYETALRSGTPESRQQFQQDFPIEAQQFGANEMKQFLDRLNLERTKVETFGQILSGVSDQSSYDRALQQAGSMGLDLDNAPAMYDPNFINQTQRQAMSVTAQAKQMQDQLGMMLRMQQLEETKRHNRAIESIQQNKASAEKMTGKERQAQELQARGYPPKVAEAIGHGLIERTQDAMGLTTIWRHKGTNEVVAELDSRGNIVTKPGWEKLAGNLPEAPQAPTGGKQGSQPIIAVNPQTGERLQLINGQWQPLRQ